MYVNGNLHFNVIEPQAYPQVLKIIFRYIPKKIKFILPKAECSICKIELRASTRIETISSLVFQYGISYFLKVAYDKLVILKSFSIKKSSNWSKIFGSYQPVSSHFRRHPRMVTSNIMRWTWLSNRTRVSTKAVSSSSRSRYRPNTTMWWD